MNETEVIAPAEIVNLEECKYFVSQIHEKLEGGCQTLIVDCREVQYLNSMAMGTLLEAHGVLLQRNGRLRLVGPTPFVRRCLETVGMLMLVEVFETMDEAVVLIDGTGA